jgi:hypothetical protein
MLSPDPGLGCAARPAGLRPPGRGGSECRPGSGKMFRAGGWTPVAPISGDPKNGAELALFFYDAPISRAVAFEGLCPTGMSLPPG